MVEVDLAALLLEPLILPILNFKVHWIGTLLHYVAHLGVLFFDLQLRFLLYLFSFLLTFNFGFSFVEGLVLPLSLNPPLLDPLLNDFLFCFFDFFFLFLSDFIGLIISPRWLITIAHLVVIVDRCVGYNFGSNGDLPRSKELFLLYSIENDKVPVGRDYVRTFGLFHVEEAVFDDAVGGQITFKSLWLHVN